MLLYHNKEVKKITLTNHCSCFIFFFFKQIIWGFRTTRIPNIQEGTDVVKERQKVVRHGKRKGKSKNDTVRENRQHSWVDRGFQYRDGNYKKAEIKDSKLKKIHISDMKNPSNGLIYWRNLHPRRRLVNGTSVRNYQNENSWRRNIWNQNRTS